MTTKELSKIIQNDVKRKGYSMRYGQNMCYDTGNKQPSDIARQICKHTGLEYDCFINEDGNGEYLFRENSDETLKEAVYFWKKNCTDVSNSSMRIIESLDRKLTSEQKKVYVLSGLVIFFVFVSILQHS